MIIELLRELDQMIQGHPNAVDEYSEEVAELKKSIAGLETLKLNQKAKNLSTAETEKSLKSQRTRLSQLLGE